MFLRGQATLYNVGLWFYNQNMLVFHFTQPHNVAIPVCTRLFCIDSAPKHLAAYTWGMFFLRTLALLKHKSHSTSQHSYEFHALAVDKMSLSFLAIFAMQIRYENNTRMGSIGSLGVFQKAMMRVPWTFLQANTDITSVWVKIRIYWDNLIISPY